MRGGAFFNGKEGRDDFRKTAPEGGYIPNPYGRDLGLGYRVRTPSSQEGDRGVEKCYRALAAYSEACHAERFRFTIRYHRRSLQVIGLS